MSAEQAAPEQTVREFLAEQLTGLLPATWTIIPHQKVPETIDTTTVVFSITRISKLKEAPRSLANVVTILVMCPLTEAARAESSLDDDVLAVCHALSQHPRIVWDEARKAQATSRYFGWDIDVTVLSTPTPTEPTTDPAPEQE